MTMSREPVDQGLTLIELIVYSALLVLVSVIAGGLLMSSVQSTKLVRSVTEATSIGQQIDRGVQRAVRNASAVKDPFTPNAVAVGVAGTQVFIVESVTGGAVSTRQCQAWFYVPSRGGQLFIKTLNPPAALSIPNVAYVAGVPAGTPVSAPTGWQSYGEGINADGTLPFHRSGNRVTFSVTVSAGTSAPVQVSGSVTNRQVSIGTSSACF